VGMRILGILLRVVSATAKAIVWPGAGWFAFILSLVKTYRDVRVLVQEGLESELA
jgi:hypothetical protein